jgi:hypothetical protein
MRDAMFDLGDDLGDFYEQHVRLGRARSRWLAGVRDANLERLKAGLDALSDKEGANYAHFRDAEDQGGYAMRTLNQTAGNDYDIDVALTFDEHDLPADPSAARQLVCDAFREKPGNFSRPPIARTNAVTVWYADGPHVDFAIYRRRVTTWGEILIEHAGGSEWTKRDPNAVTDWFEERVAALSPSPIAQRMVAAEQLRRIVRFLKFFCRSRLDWDLPGGMVMTTLAVECYRPNGERDDVALFDTMVALYYRLQTSLRVQSPVEPTQELTAKVGHGTQVEELRDKLGWALEKLAALGDSSCTRSQARNAWRLVFNHDYWNAQTGRSESLLQPVGTASGLTFPNRPTGPVKPAGFA